MADTNEILGVVNDETEDLSNESIDELKEKYDGVIRDDDDNTVDQSFDNFENDVEKYVEEVAEVAETTNLKEEKKDKASKDSQGRKSKYVSPATKMWIKIGAAALAIILLAVAIIPLLDPKSPILTNKTVITVDGTKVEADEYSYYVGYLVDSYATYYGYEYFQDKTNFGYVLDTVNDALKQHYVAYNWAVEEGYDLTDDEIKEIDDQIEGVKATFESEEAFIEALKTNHLTLDLYRKMLIADKVIAKFSDGVYGDSSRYAPDDSDVVRMGEENGILGAKHILILGQDDPAENDAALARANELLEMIRDGGDFDQIMNENSEDPGMADYPNGYTFMDGEMVPEFYDATSQLNVGDVSGIVTSDYGFHIIKRVEPDFAETRRRLIGLSVDAIYEEKMETAVVKLSSGYENISYFDFDLPTVTPAESVVGDASGSEVGSATE